MPLTLDVTVGGASANSYNSVAEADAYFAARPGSEAWTGTDEVKKAALIAATNRLDTESFEGIQVTTTQRLKHPRYGLTTDDGWPYASDAIARPVKEAHLEIALALLQNTKGLSKSGLLQFEQLQVGSISLTPSKSGLNPDSLPPQAVRLLRGIWCTLSGQTEIVRG